VDKSGILIALSSSNQTSYGNGEAFSMQTTPQKIFSAIWAVEAEVNNGGFSQYFFNGSSETAEFVVEALNVIGAPRTAEICRRAITVAFPAGLPSDPKQFRPAAAEFSDDTLEKLDALDHEFFQYPHNLTDLLFDYVARHPEEFGKLPDSDDA
jgi:hypothetical protein